MTKSALGKAHSALDLLAEVKYSGTEFSMFGENALPPPPSLSFALSIKTARVSLVIGARPLWGKAWCFSQASGPTLFIVLSWQRPQEGGVVQAQAGRAPSGPSWILLRNRARCKGQ